MRLLLHLGNEKTGTSAIQKWLHVNSDLLYEEGVYYSKCLGRPNNRKIAVYARDSDKPDDGFKVNGIKSPEDHERFRRTLESDFAQEVEGARAEGCHTFVISNEHLHSRITSYPMVERVHGLLAAYFDHIDVLLLLRSQVDLLVSFLSTAARGQNLSGGGLRKTPYDFYVDYYALYERWDRYFPNRVNVANYKEVGNVINFIKNLLQLRQERYREIEKVNEKIDYRAAALGKNIGLPCFYGHEPNRNRFFFQNQLPVQQPITISKDEAAQIQERFHARNLELEKLTGGQITADELWPDLDRYPHEGNLDRAIQEVDFAPMLQEMVVRFNVQLWLEKARNAISQTQRDLAKKNIDSAFKRNKESYNFTMYAKQAELEDKGQEIENLENQINALFAECCYQRGLSEEREDNLEAAEGWLADAVAHAPGKPPFRRAHARLLDRLGEREKAIAEVEKALELGPGDPIGTRIQAAALYESAGRTDEARSIYGEVLARQPDNDKALAGQARLGSRRDDG